jgi:hypothetical protein
LYSPEEIKAMFTEMDAMGMLFPFNSAPEIQEKHVQWREWYHKYWFDKWFNKRSRKL